MVLVFSFTRGIRIENGRGKWQYRPGRDGIPTSVVVEPAKKKLWFAFATAFATARRAPNEVLALDELKVAVLAAFQEARNARDEAIALQKKEKLEADKTLPTDMVPGADERRRKKNGMREEVEADRAVLADTSPSDDERRGKKNEMTERKRKKLNY